MLYIALLKVLKGRLAVFLASIYGPWRKRPWLLHNVFDKILCASVVKNG